MMVRQEDMPERGQWHPGESQLACDTITAIDDVGRVIRDDDLCRSRVGLARPRSAPCAEEDQPHWPLPSLQTELVATVLIPTSRYTNFCIAASKRAGTTTSPIRRMGTSIGDGWRESSRPELFSVYGLKRVRAHMQVSQTIARDIRCNSRVEWTTVLPCASLDPQEAGHRPSGLRLPQKYSIRRSWGDDASLQYPRFGSSIR